MSKWSAINQPLAGTHVHEGLRLPPRAHMVVHGSGFRRQTGAAVITITVIIGLALWPSCAGAKTPAHPGSPGVVRDQPAAQFRVDDLGPLAYLVPAHADLYFRRFVMGSQLAGLYLAGTGVVLIWQLLRRVVDFLVVLAAHAVAGDRVYRCRCHCLGVARRRANSQLRRSRYGRYPGTEGRRRIPGRA